MQLMNYRKQNCFAQKKTSFFVSFFCLFPTTISLQLFVYMYMLNLYVLNDMFIIRTCILCVYMYQSMCVHVPAHIQFMGGAYSEIVVEADICLETTRGSGGQRVPIAIPELQLHLVQELVNI